MAFGIEPEQSDSETVLFTSTLALLFPHREAPFGSQERERDSSEATGLWAGLVFSSGRKLGPGEIPKAHRYLGNAAQA